MFKYKPGQKVKYQGRTFMVMHSWFMEPGQPWYELRRVQGTGFTGYYYGVPERRLETIT